MLGKKVYQEKLFTNFSLASKIPDNNFYKQLKEELDLSFLYKVCRPYYGECGQKSIDPIVFFKLILVGYLEGVTSDRKLVDLTNLRMDILYFINYDIDEKLPWHSTISRTRKKLPAKVSGQCLFRNSKTSKLSFKGVVRLPFFIYQKQQSCQGLIYLALKRQ